MEKKAVLALMTLLALPLLAQDRMAELNAPGCVTTHITGCSITERGELASGDCTFNDGTRFDRYELTLPAGQAVAITLRPLDASFTAPQLLVSRPLSHPSTPPVVERGPAATVFVKTKTAATWVVAVATRDLFASGRYALHVDCFADTTPSSDCVEQELLCGNHAFGHLSAESCRFGSAPKAYQEWIIWGVEGDRLNIEMQSLDFEPIFGIYRDGDLLRSADTPNRGTASITNYRVPSTGYYSILATTVANNVGGDYFLDIGCTKSGCLFPYITDLLPPVVSAPFGQPAVITFNVHSIFPFTAFLYGDDLSPAATSDTNTIVTPPASAGPQNFLVRVESPCGTFDSNTFTLVPELGRRRSVRH